jgi:hypothetical protein
LVKRGSRVSKRGSGTEPDPNYFTLRLSLSGVSSR